MAFQKVKSMFGIESHGLSDSFDQLNCIITPILLILVAVIFATAVKSPTAVNCWVTPQLSDQKSYVNAVCGSQSEYWIPKQELIPNEIPERENKMLFDRRYELVPQFLVICAVLFAVVRCVPRILTVFSSVNIGANIKSIVRQQEKNDPNIADKVAAFVYGYKKGKFINFTLPLVPIFNKVVYIILTFALFKSLGNQFGLEIKPSIKSLMSFTSLYLGGVGCINEIRNVTVKICEPLRPLPSMVMCDFEIRILGNLHRHTAQCSIETNYFSTYVWVVLYIWFFVLGIITVVGLISTIWKVSPINYFLFVSRYASMNGIAKSSTIRSAIPFDIFVFLLRVEEDIGEVFVMDVIGKISIQAGPAPLQLMQYIPMRYEQQQQQSRDHAPENTEFKEKMLHPSSPAQEKLLETTIFSG